MPAEVPRHDSVQPEQMIASHVPRRIRERLAVQHRPSYLKDFVYGAIDGAVTTFAVVSGVAGAGLSANVVLILGVANLVGDGFSMAAGNFLGTRAELEQFARLRLREQQHIQFVPEGEREEVREIFRQKGFSGELLEQVVAVITEDENRWIETMLREEYGVSLIPVSAWKAALTTFAAFLIVGLIPLLPFVISGFGVVQLSQQYMLSTVLTGLAFFAIGAVKSRFVDRHWLYSGAETLIVGGLAASLAYACGVLLSSFA